MPFWVSCCESLASRSDLCCPSPLLACIKSLFLARNYCFLIEIMTDAWSSQVLVALGTLFTRLGFEL
jgi:hypothetical protein